MWRDLGSSLGYTFSQIDDICSSLGPTPRNSHRVKKILESWCSSSENATLGDLLKACDRAKIKGAVQMQLRNSNSGNLNSTLPTTRQTFCPAAAGYLHCGKCHRKIAHSSGIIPVVESKSALSTCSYEKGILGRSAWSQHFRNPYGYEFDVVTVTAGCSSRLAYHGNPTLEHTWFPGYKWDIIYCQTQTCQTHLGWHFYHDRSTGLPTIPGGGDEFVGLVIDRFDAHLLISIECKNCLANLAQPHSLKNVNPRSLSNRRVKTDTHYDVYGSTDRLVESHVFPQTTDREEEEIVTLGGLKQSSTPSEASWMPSRWFCNSLQRDVHCQQIASDGCPMLVGAEIKSSTSHFTAFDLKKVSLPKDMALDALSRSSSASSLLRHCNHALSSLHLC